MFELLLNLLFVLLMLCPLALLAHDRKKKRNVETSSSQMQLSLDLKNSNGVGVQRVVHVAYTMQELQEFLNAFALFRIHRAGVWQDAKMTHVMNTLGILEAV